MKFKVKINDGNEVVAGLGQFGVLVANVYLEKKEDNKINGKLRFTASIDENGRNTFFDWPNLKVVPGDRITIDVGIEDQVGLINANQQTFDMKHSADIDSSIFAYAMQYIGLMHDLLEEATEIETGRKYDQRKAQVEQMIEEIGKMVAQYSPKGQ